MMDDYYIPQDMLKEYDEFLGVTKNGIYVFDKLNSYFQMHGFGKKEEDAEERMMEALAEITQTSEHEVHVVEIEEHTIKIVLQKVSNENDEYFVLVAASITK